MKSKSAFVLGCIFAVIAVIMILVVLFSKIPENPPGTLGNSAGNILNKGLLAEANGRVYFSNGADNGSLYSMNPDESKVKKLINHDICFINTAGNYLYYYELNDNNTGAFAFLGRNMGIYRSDLNGGRSYCLQKAPVKYICLADNDLYYEYFTNKATNSSEDSGIGLYSITIQKKGRTLLSEDPVIPANILNGQIYYAGQSEDHDLHAFSIDSKDDNIVIEGSFWNPIIYNSYVY
ncbi:MAG: DUF5050 domain-containing protein, partial [Lachnospiraceae bacterium]|nr:DUF5050 domain-containing protein [Lachnospiraceae bacterium]